MNTTVVDPPNVDDEPLCADASNKTMPDIQTLATEQVKHVNVHIPSAVSTVLGALPGILALRPGE